MYKIKTNSTPNGTVKIIIKENDDGSVTSFGEYPDNTDYIAYKLWLSEGNVPLPADEQGAQ